MGRCESPGREHDSYADDRGRQCHRNPGRCGPAQNLSHEFPPPFFWPHKSGQDPRWNSTPAPNCQSFEGSESRARYRKSRSSEEPEGRYFQRFSCRCATLAQTADGQLRPSQPRRGQFRISWPSVRISGSCPACRGGKQRPSPCRRRTSLRNESHRIRRPWLLHLIPPGR
jgi:hypothetical protein